MEYSELLAKISLIGTDKVVFLSDLNSDNYDNCYLSDIVDICKKSGFDNKAISDIENLLVGGFTVYIDLEDNRFYPVTDTEDISVKRFQEVSKDFIDKYMDSAISYMDAISSKLGVI